MPVAQPKCTAQPDHTNDHLQHHDERHHLGGRQYQAEQRHRGEAETETGKTAQQRGRKYTEHGNRQRFHHRVCSLRPCRDACPGAVIGDMLSLGRQPSGGRETEVEMNAVTGDGSSD